jgi:hypothetical protein
MMMMPCPLSSPHVLFQSHPYSRNMIYIQLNNNALIFHPFGRHARSQFPVGPVPVVQALAQAATNYR